MTDAILSLKSCRKAKLSYSYNVVYVLEVGDGLRPTELMLRPKPIILPHSMEIDQELFELVDKITNKQTNKYIHSE